MCWISVITKRKKIIYSIKRFKLILKLQLNLSFEKLKLNTTNTPIAVPNINIQHRYDFPFLILPDWKKQYFIITTTIPLGPIDYKGCLKNIKLSWKLCMKIIFISDLNITPNITKRVRCFKMATVRMKSLPILF